jgi:hypothetical protein
MNKTVLSTLLVLTLSACGGGGGGDGSPSPASVSPNPGNGGGNPPPNLQTGIFTDSPVAGLRYRQGEIQGVTDTDGRFTYDSNNAAKIEFLISNASIGFARGAPAVTPFDLQTEAGSLNYHRGINVSRLLVSLDVDSNPSNGIELSSDLEGFAGNFPFDLQPSEFGQDAQLVRMLPLFGVSQLASEDDVLDHIADNNIIVQKLDSARAQLDALGNVRVRWNPDLDSAGVLADIQADNGERLIILVDGTTALHVSAAVYFDAAGRYAFVSYLPNGTPHSINANGSAIRTLTVNNPQSFADYVLALDLPNYTAPTNRLLIDTSSDSITLGHAHPSTSTSVVTTISRLLESIADDNDMLNLASSIMGDITPAFCNEERQCSSNSILSYGLQQAISDTQYLGQRFSLSQVGSSALTVTDLCLSTTAFNIISTCVNGISLLLFLDVVQSFSTTMISSWDNARTLPWANGTFSYILEVTSRERMGMDQPSAIPAGSADAPTPWIEAKATFDFRVKALRLNDEYYYSELEFLRISSPLSFRECAYTVRQSNGTLIPGCTAFSASINSTQRQAVSDAMSDVMRLMQQRSQLHAEYDAAPGTYQNVPLEYFSDAHIRRLFSIQYLPQLAAYAESVTDPLADKILAGLQRHYTYISPSQVTSENLSSGFGMPAVLDPSEKIIGYNLGGLLIDPRFQTGSAYINFGVDH